MSPSLQERYERLPTGQWLTTIWDCANFGAPSAAGCNAKLFGFYLLARTSGLNITHLFSGDESGSFKAAEHRNHAHY